MFVAENSGEMILRVLYSADLAADPLAEGGMAQNIVLGWGVVDVVAGLGLLVLARRGPSHTGYFEAIATAGAVGLLYAFPYDEDEEGCHAFKHILGRPLLRGISLAATWGLTRGLVRSRFALDRFTLVRMVGLTASIGDLAYWQTVSDSP